MYVAANLMPFFSNGLGSNPSVFSSTVLSPVSGSDGFRSSVFLSCCAWTGDGSATKTRPMMMSHRMTRHDAVLHVPDNAAEAAMHRYGLCIKSTLQLGPASGDRNRLPCGQREAS